MNQMNESQKSFFALVKNSPYNPSAMKAGHIKNIAKGEDFRGQNFKIPWKLIEDYKTDPKTWDISVFVDASDGEVPEPPPFKDFPIVEKKKITLPEEILEVVTLPEVEKIKIKEIAEDAPAGYFVPRPMSNFVSFGEMSTTNKIIKSRKFCPTFIFGETGLGKSLSVNQLACKLNREVIRINVNAQTCEEDFIGGFRLVNGETVWQDGPLITAMKRGCIFLIDEMSALNPAYAFCLFSALEGEPVYIKKINRIVEPAEGFNIIATDNTRGSGTSSGRWTGVNVQNEALLDRFIVCLQYDYPSPAQEFRILEGISDNQTAVVELIKWANFVRKTYKEGAIEVTISPRRLVGIIKINEIFGSLQTSISHSIARFEDDIKESLIDFFNKIVNDPDYSNNDAFTDQMEDMVA